LRRETEDKDESIEVWACHWKTLKIMRAMGTQWRTGMNGATGLDYAALPTVAAALKVRLSASRLAGLRALEAEILRLWRAR
jgi:hypothetical protein